MTDAPKDMLTAAEIAALRLPGLPRTESAVTKVARREDWRASGYAEKRTGRGGGWVYAWHLLPDEAQARLYELCQLAQAEGYAVRAAARAEDERRDLDVATRHLTAAQRRTMEARLALLVEVDRRRIAAGDDLRMTQVHVPSGAPRRSRNKAVAGLLAALKDGSAGPELLAAAACASERGGIPSRAQIMEWYRWRHSQGAIALAPKPKRLKEPLPGWFDEFLDHYAVPSKPTIADALRAYTATVADPARVPSMAQVRRALDKLPALERLAGREGKLALRSKMAFIRRDTSDLMPTSVYISDGHTFKAEVAHPSHGRPFRPEVTPVLDVATRVCVGWSVDLSENAFGTADALRMSCSEWGICALWYSDRGPGFVAEGITDPVVGLMARAGITPMKALPYNSQARGLIERFHQTLHAAARTLPTYVGARMDREAKKNVFDLSRKQLKETGTSRLHLPWTEFVALIRDTQAIYNETPHRGLPTIREGGKKRHLTPREMWDRAVAEGFEPILPDAAEIEDMFRPYVIRTVQRAEIAFNTNRYFAIELEAYHGEEVAVGYEIADASRVWVRTLERTDKGREPGALIAVAAFEGNSTRYVPLTAERAAAEKRAEARRRRLGLKLEEVEAELDPSALLIGDASYDLPPPLDLNVEPVAPAAAPALVAVDRGEEEGRSAVPPTGRPTFFDDAPYAEWLIAHPDEVTADDAEYFRDLLSSRTEQRNLAVHGVDLERLRALLRQAA